MSKALEFLNSDEAHDLFSGTFKFVQTGFRSQAREKASAVLRAAAQKTSDPKLSTLAQSVKLDAFTKVKKAIDDMIVNLKKEKEDEIKHRDFCVEAFHENESVTSRKNRDKSDLEAKSGELGARIEELTATIKDLKDQVAEANVELKRAGEDREKQNLEFQKTVADQRATVKLLSAAMNVLKGFYEKSDKAGFLQEPAGPPPPAGFKSYENNAGGGGVIAMITQIINDAKAMEAEAVHAEGDAQVAYESFVKETNASNKQKQKDIVNKSDAKSTAEVDKSQAESELDDTETELSQLANENADLHKSCDFVMKNFDVRQEARDQEVEALGQAKSILSGAK